MEAGVYGMVERGGVRQFRVPQRDRPGALQGDRLRFISSAVDGVNRLLSATEASVNAPASIGSTAPPGTLQSALANSVGAGGGASSIAPSSRRQSANNITSRAFGGAMGGSSFLTGEEAEEADDQVGTLPGLPPDLEQLKAQWEAVMRDTITNQVVSDLKSDKTIDYIRSLESQMGRLVSHMGSIYLFRDPPQRVQNAIRSMDLTN
jgi:kinesin family protein 7